MIFSLQNTQESNLVTILLTFINIVVQSIYIIDRLVFTLLLN